MLLGREAELGRLRDVWMDARGWAGSAILVSGDPGIGKTTLLEAAADAAGLDGLRVLRTRGTRSEETLPFAALSRLLRPIASRIADLPTVQAALLGGALGFAEASPADPFAVAAAALNLLAIVSTEQPILLVCDDAQWLDPASLSSLLFITGRLTEQAISIAYSARSDGVAGELARIEMFELAGLDAEPARALLAGRFGERLAPEVATALIDATGGNPLALLEIPEMLSGRQLLGLDPLVSPLPVGEATSAAYRYRISQLPHDTRRALVVAAASDRDDAVVLQRAFAALQISPDALAAAEDAGLVRLEGPRIEFRHALVRSVAHHDANVSERRAAHRALAAALGGDDPRGAWHLAAASAGPDELVAGALEAAAMVAMTRSGFGEASIALGRAADLSTDPEGRFRRQVGAARTAFFAGDIARAKTLTAEALRVAPDPRSLALAQQLRGRIDIWWPVRPMRETGARLVGESAAIAEVDADIAIAILFDAVFAFIASGLVSEARAPAARAVELARHARDRALVAEVAAIHGWVEILTGTNAGAIEKMIRIRDQIDRTRPEAAQLSLFLDVPLQLMGAHDEFLAVLAAGIEGARSAAALVPLATLLSIRAEGELHIGRWQLAEIDALEALSLSPPGFAISAYANAILARLDALKGNAEACRARVQQTLQQGAVGEEGVAITFARVALATLEQTLGNLQRAFELYVENGAAEERLGLRNPLITNTLIGIVETGVLVGQHDVARRHQESLESAAAALGAPSLHAFAAHGRGLLARGDDYRDAFEEALTWHELGGRRFDQARTQLVYGERLRRDRRRVESRRLLRAAIDAFDEIGSAPWSERARRELQATGEKTHPRVASSRELLTPQELQVARLAAEGLSNNEIAARLFISPRTVEKHLGQAFRKLDVPSRRGLIVAGPALLGS